MSGDVTRIQVNDIPLPTTPVTQVSATGVPLKPAPSSLPAVSLLIRTGQGSLVKTGSDQSQTEIIQDCFQKVSAYFKEKNSKLEWLDFTHRTCTVVKGKDKKEVDLLDVIEDAGDSRPAMEQALEKVYEVAEELGYGKKPEYEKSLKGSLDAEPVLQRVPEEGRLSALPRDHGKGSKFEKEYLEHFLKDLPDDAQKEVARNRIQKFSEFYASVLEKAKKAQEKYSPDQKPTDAAELKKFDEEAKELQRFVAEVENCDVFAIQAALVYYPKEGDTAEQIQEKTEKLISRVGKAIDATARGITSKLFRRGHSEPKLNAKEEVYAREVGSLLVQGRLNHIAYCKAHQLSIQREGIEEGLFIKHVISQESDKGMDWKWLEKRTEKEEDLVKKLIQRSVGRLPEPVTAVLEEISEATTSQSPTVPVPPPAREEEDVMDFPTPPETPPIVLEDVKLDKKDPVTTLAERPVHEENPDEGTELRPLDDGRGVGK